MRTKITFTSMGHLETIELFEHKKESTFFPRNSYNWRNDSSFLPVSSTLVFFTGGGESSSIGTLARCIETVGSKPTKDHRRLLGRSNDRCARVRPCPSFGSGFQRTGHVPRVSHFEFDKTSCCYKFIGFWTQCKICESFKCFLIDIWRTENKCESK